MKRYIVQFVNSDAFCYFSMEVSACNMHDALTIGRWHLKGREPHAVIVREVAE